MLLTEQKTDEARKCCWKVVRPKPFAYHDAWDAFSQNEADDLTGSHSKVKPTMSPVSGSFGYPRFMRGLITGGIAIFTVMRMGREMAVRQRRRAIALQEAHGQLELRIQERTRRNWKKTI